MMFVFGTRLCPDAATHQGAERVGDVPRGRDDVGAFHNEGHQRVRRDQRRQGDEPGERPTVDETPRARD
jgi:hypothetical protein